MADNVAITAGSGTTIAADDIGGVLHQRVKLSIGADGEAADLDHGQALMAASLPVAIASNQSAVPITDNDGSITVDGTVAVTNAGITTIAGAVAGTEMQVDVLSSALPTGASTAALQGGGLPAALGAGGGLKVDGSGTALPVSLATAPALVASSAYIGNSGPDTVSKEIVPTCEAAAYHAGDVLFDSAEIATLARANGTGVELVSLVARDLDDNAAAALTLFFFNANTSLGTKNAAPDIDDTEILTLVGLVTIPAAAWTDMGASKVAVMQNIGQLMHPTAGSTSLWVAGMTAGTPTQTASGIKLTFQFVRY